MNYFQSFSWIEWIGVCFTLLYNYFMMRENSWCWLFGIASSICALIIFYQKDLMGQACLNLFYMAMAIYGLISWRNAEKKNTHILVWKANHHFYALLIGIMASIVLYVLLKNYTENKQPIFDAMLTVFCLLATYKEVKKILSGWIYWIVLNIASAVLYFQNDLYGYFILMIIYSGLSIVGYFEWKKIYEKHLH